MKVCLPRDTVSDTDCRLVAIHVENGQDVAAGAVLFEFESSKSVFDVHAESAGRITWDTLNIDQFYPVGGQIARLIVDGESEACEEPSLSNVATEATDLLSGSTVVSHAAVRSHSEDVLSETHSNRRFIRSTDVTRSTSDASRESTTRDVAETEFQRNLESELRRRRVQMQESFQRHVPTGTLLHDRWALAKSLGFGEGSSIYDEALVLGDIQIGRQCWIGPFVVLDGLHAHLAIGDFTSIGSGCQLYTHDTIARVLTGNDALCHTAPTRIGKHCFIAPQVIISPGTIIGDHCLVTGGSVVQGTFPDYSVIQGNPAIRTGWVRLTSTGFRVERDS